MFRAAAFLFLAAGLAAGRADPPPKVFPNPERIRYDGECLTIEGRDVLVFSGAFQPFRCPRPLWRERFARLKAAGCNAVDIGVPWNSNGRGTTASPGDFSQADLSGLRDWLHMAHDEFGLYTIVRPGPGIAADSDGTRSRRWLKAVCPVVGPEQVTRRPPGRGGVILLQLETERGQDPGVSESARMAQLRALYEAAVACGIEVPVFTCGTGETRGSADPDLSQVFDAVGVDLRLPADTTAQRLRDLQAAQPDAPAMMLETPAGPGLASAQFEAHALAAVQEGATILTVGVGDDCPAAKAIGLMLQRHGQALARSKIIACQTETGDPEVTVVARRARNGDTYLFFRNHAVDRARRGTVGVWLEAAGETQVPYALEPFGFRVLFLPKGVKDPSRGEWLPQPDQAEPRPNPL